MGYYVNPPQESKEAFLEKNGIHAHSDIKIAWSEVPEGFLPVVLLDNGPFTAAGIAYSERELEAFTSPTDRRPRKIYMVPIEKLLLVSGGDFKEYVEKNSLV